jgi:transposase
MNKAVNDVRIFEHKVFNEMGDETLKGTRQIWLYGEENLPEKYELQLEKLKEKKLKTGRAWAIKELLRDFWDCKSVDEGTTFLKSWYNWAIRSKLEPVKKVARMVKSHLRNIVSYFKYHLTNAALEGINNKVQALIKKAYGYRNKKRFKIDILFHCGGLNLYPNIVQ